MDNPRPTSVTVISIIFIVLNSLGILGLAAGLAIFALVGSRPEMAAAQAQLRGHGSIGFIMGVDLVEVVIGLVLAAYMLKGYNWARQLFLMVQGAGIIVGWILVGFHPVGSVIGVVIFGVVLYFLTRRDAVGYFTYEPQIPRSPVCRES